MYRLTLSYYSGLTPIIPDAHNMGYGDGIATIAMMATGHIYGIVPAHPGIMQGAPARRDGFSYRFRSLALRSTFAAANRCGSTSASLSIDHVTDSPGSKVTMPPSMDASASTLSTMQNTSRA